MCVAGIARLSDAWDERGARVGRLDDGSIVSLLFVPDAEPGGYVLVHLGIPVEVLDPEAALEELARRADLQREEEARR